MKPVIIITPDNLGEEDIKQLRDNGVCVVIAKDPSGLKYYDYTPKKIGSMDQAAIDCFRTLLNAGKGWEHLQSNFGAMFAQRLIKGTDMEIPKK